MKPIYKKSMFEQLDELIQKAKDERKELEAIELTCKEYSLFYNEAVAIRSRIEYGTPLKYKDISLVQNKDEFSCTTCKYSNIGPFCKACSNCDLALSNWEPR